MVLLNSEQSSHQTRSSQIASARASLVSSYLETWSRMMGAWNSSGDEDLAWLMYSANYLLRTSGVRWAIDPMTLRSRVPEAPEVNIANDLEGLDFVLLTHEHEDHLDFDLIRRLGEHPIFWIIPKELLSIILSEAELQRERIIIPTAFKPIEIFGLRITPFCGSHSELTSSSLSADDRVKEVLASGYLVEAAQKRWLFPGDTRTYNPSIIDQFGPVDVVFAHLWLGRHCALMIEPPLVDEFCRFFTATKPRKIVLTHLEEHGRSVEDYWTRSHADLVLKRLREFNPLVDVVIPKLGEPIGI